MADRVLTGEKRAEIETTVSTWSPLRNRIFAILLLTQLFTQLSVFMNGLAGAWVLTDITDSAAVVSLLLVAVALPSFLLALLAGALADIVSRKTIILVAQAGNVLVAAAFAVLAATDSHSTASIIGLTAALGTLTALAAPAWLAIIPGLVPRSELTGAMTLSSAGVSVAMALGPALGGFIIAATGPTWVFALNAVVFAAGILALQVWKPAPRTGLPAEHLVSAMRTGLQYVIYDRSLKIVIAKVIPYAFTSTALISLLPAIARFKLDAGPALFGLIAGAAGIGAVIALLVLPHIRRYAGPDGIVLGSMLIQAAVLLIMATTSSIAVAFVVLIFSGAATLALVSTVMTVMQIVLPAWIRGRGVAVYLLALQGSFAVGALVWGTVAERTSLSQALLIAGAVMLIGAVVSAFFRIGQYVDVNTDVVEILPDLLAVTSIHDDDGPILLTAEWQIDPEQHSAFIAAMNPVRISLKRMGALSWHLVEDVQQPGKMLESFSVATWSEYQRLPSRTTAADREILDALQLAAGTDAPEIRAHRVVNVQKPLDTMEKEDSD